MKTLLLALTFSWTCSRNGCSGQLSETQISGNWHTIAIAAADIDLITDDGIMKLFFRHLECIDGCQKIILTFYSEVDEECQKFETEAQKMYSRSFTFTYAGSHSLWILYVSNATMICHNLYLDTDENLKHLLFLVGKEDSVSEEEQQKFTELCDKTRIPKENIRYMLEKDICPK